MTSNAEPNRPAESADFRRPLLLVASLVCGVIGVYQAAFGTSTAGSAFGAGVFVRAAVALFLFWLAYPSLRRPARWLPPGVLLIGLGVLALVVAHPRMVPVLLPLIGLLTAVAALLGWWRKVQ